MKTDEIIFLVYAYFAPMIKSYYHEGSLISQPYHRFIILNQYEFAIKTISKKVCEYSITLEKINDIGTHLYNNIL